MKTLLIIGMFLVVSCGSEQTEQSQSTPETIGVTQSTDEEDESVYYVEMPRCIKAKEEKLLYIAQDEIFLVCRDSQWMVLDLNITSEMPECDTTEVLNETEQE
jgi:hypothetical protein